MHILSFALTESPWKGLREKGGKKNRKKSVDGLGKGSRLSALFNSLVLLSRNADRKENRQSDFVVSKS
jgi:hypothetical protein